MGLRSNRNERQLALPVPEVVAVRTGADVRVEQPLGPGASTACEHLVDGQTARPHRRRDETRGVASSKLLVGVAEIGRRSGAAGHRG